MGEVGMANNDGEPRESISVYIKKRHNEWMEAKNINKSGFIDDLIDNYRAGGGQVEDALQRMREQQLESELESATNRVEQMENELARIREKREREKEWYVERLGEILETMEEGGGRMWPEAKPIQDLAVDKYGDTRDSEKVIEDLREKAAEDDYDIDESQFSEP